MEDKEYLTKTDKLGEFLKNNVINFVLILMCAVYILKGFAEIDTQNKSVSSIIADGVLSFIVSVSIKSILRQKGLNNGYESRIFQITCSAYGSEIEKISPKIELLDEFCKEENDKRLALAQKNELIRNAISYDEFISDKYELKPRRRDFNGDKERYKRELLKYKKCQKVRKMRIYKYTSKLITNAYDSNGSEDRLLSANAKVYQAKNTLSNIMIGALCGLLFGYYNLKRGDAVLANIIWSSIQIVLYLVFGFIQYLKSYEYVTKTIREKIKRIMVLIDKFKNQYMNKEVFKDE